MGTFSDTIDVDLLCDQGDDEYDAERWRQAGTCYKRALDTGAAQMPLDRRIYVRMALAVCFFFSESYEDVVEYDRATLRILKAERGYGVDHEYTVGTRYRLARALVDSVTKSDRGYRAKWDEAVTIYEENARVADKELLLKTRKGLASVYFKLTQYLKAEEIYERLLEEGEAKFLDGKDDESLELKHEYAAVQYHLKRYSRSKRLFSQIEETILLLPNSRKRKLGKLSQDVDKYLAACFEATLDLDRGVARSVAASRERKHSPPAPVKQSSAKDALHQPRQFSPAAVAAGRKTSGSKEHAGPNDDAAASVNTRRHTSTNTEAPQKDNHDISSSTGKRSSKTNSSPPLAGPSKSTPNLSVPSSAAPKTRRSSSDHSVTRSREAMESVTPAARSRSEHSPSRSKHTSDSELRPNSLRPESREKKSSQFQSRSHATDSESTSRSEASPRSKQRSSDSTSRSMHASDSESRSKSKAKLRPKAKVCHSSSSIHSSDSESRPKSVAPLRSERESLQSQSRSNATDSGPRPQSALSLRPEKIPSHSPSNSKDVSDSQSKPKSVASLRPEQKPSHSPSKSKDGSDSESKPKPVPSPRPKQKSSHSLSKVTDSSDSESRTPQSRPRSKSNNESTRSASESTLPSYSRSGSPHSPSKPTPPSDTKTKSSHLASESTAPSSPRIQSSHTSPSEGESRPSRSHKGPSDSNSTPSRPTSSSSESYRKSVASTNLGQASSNNGRSHKEHPSNNPKSLRTSEPHRSRSVSAPSTGGTSSARSAGAIESPDQPSERSRAQAKVPQVVISKPSMTFQVPGSWPEDFSSLVTNVQETKELGPLELKDRRRSLGEDTVASLTPTNDVPRLERPRSRSCASPETGMLYDLPEGAPEADRWFGELRKHTHRLLYHDEEAPKNPGRKLVRVAILDSGLADNCDDASVPMARQSRRKIRTGQVTYKDFTGDSPSRTDSKENLHGTWCASFLMQVAPHAELYVANVVQRKKKGQESQHVAKAIKWAIEQQVDVISMSFGWDHEMPEVGEQIDRARAKGILLFAAASNDGDFTPKHGVYPASHHLVYCIYSCRGLGNSSEFNPRFTDDAAKFMFPGEDLAILETNNKPVTGTVRQSGTSFATPIAAGIAAMILDLARLTLEDSEEVERRLKKVEGMTAILRAMSTGARDGGYYHIQPWTLLGKPKPIESLHNPNESHQWFTLMNMLGLLRDMFGPYKTPLS